MDEGAEEETDIAGPEPEASPPPPQTAPVSDDGPIVRLLNTITSDNASAYGTLRQVLLVALGVGFLTAAGFIGATWHSRRTDRKSTRLNSSHVAISYAVFCLKKKTS